MASAKQKNNNRKRRKTYINPVFYRPGEVIDFVDQEVTDLNGDDDWVINGGNNTKSDDDLNFNPPTLPANLFETYTGVAEAALPVVDNIVVESPMILKINANGNHTVDVIITVPDLTGIVSYDMRVTKAAQ